MALFLPVSGGTSDSSRCSGTLNIERNYKVLRKNLGKVFKDLRADLTLVGRVSALRFRDFVSAYAAMDVAVGWD